MLRLSLLLFVAMAFAWETLGQDNGQLRPGLAQAASEGRLEEVWATARAKEATSNAPVVAVPVVAESAPEPEPLPEPAPVVAETAPVAEPEREVVQVVEEPVFTLEAFGNESVPGEEEARTAVEALEPEAVLLPAAEPEPADDTQGRIWYVKADSVNVRAEPSTDADVLGKLGSGEALLILATVDDEWTRIVIQGDGIEGFVATRFLTPEAP